MNDIIGINDMEGGREGREGGRGGGKRREGKRRGGEGEGTSSYHVQLSSHSFLRHQEVKLHSSSPVQH